MVPVIARCLAQVQDKNFPEGESEAALFPIVARCLSRAAEAGDACIDPMASPRSVAADAEAYEDIVPLVARCFSRAGCKWNAKSGESKLSGAAAGLQEARATPLPTLRSPESHRSKRQSPHNLDIEIWSRTDASLGSAISRAFSPQSPSPKSSPVTAAVGQSAAAPRALAPMLPSLPSQPVAPPDPLSPDNSPLLRSVCSSAEDSTLEAASCTSPTGKDSTLEAASCTSPTGKDGDAFGEGLWAPRSPELPADSETPADTDCMQKQIVGEADPVGMPLASSSDEEGEADIIWSGEGREHRSEQGQWAPSSPILRMPTPGGRKPRTGDFWSRHRQEQYKGWFRGGKLPPPADLRDDLESLNLVDLRQHPPEAGRARVAATAASQGMTRASGSGNSRPVQCKDAMTVEQWSMSMSRYLKIPD
eukprot:gnl/TRDRNA2_/TRDRNA2_140120_c0_seq2.p1 gnl/TRDRNA2_/TRDRNA2_140120_c0~~gnl/TRDRNA2_/TRDRNA2_140120_c0_seq2.p1  ORF type:complete len:471 (-),score=69.63 gnl/TRDRNA2_/TRDRNA2_140120_c0_seq2:45-1304(-)